MALWLLLVMYSRYVEEFIIVSGYLIIKNWNTCRILIKYLLLLCCMNWSKGMKQWEASCSDTQSGDEWKQRDVFVCGFCNAKRRDWDWGALWVNGWWNSSHSLSTIQLWRVLLLLFFKSQRRCSWIVCWSLKAICVILYNFINKYMS